MRAFPWLLNAFESVLSSRPIVIVAVCSAALTVSPDARADNQQHSAKLTVCCGAECGTAACNLDAEIYVTSNNATCSPNCSLTALLLQPDSSVSAGCTVNSTSSFRYVRESSSCTVDGGSPFSLAIPLNSPFLVTNAEWLEIIDPNVVIEAETATAGVTVKGTKNKTSIGTPTDVPAASTWGLLALGVLVLSGGTLAIRNRWVRPTT